jgi:hypothetical protein
MQHLTHDHLMSLEQYAKARANFRAEALAMAYDGIHNITRKTQYRRVTVGAAILTM